MPLSEYEKQREENVKERLEMFASLFSEIKDANAQLRRSSKFASPPTKRCRTKANGDRAFGSRKLKFRPRTSPPRTRSASRNGSVNSSASSSPGGSPLKVRFRFSSRSRNQDPNDPDYCDDAFLDDEDEDHNLKKKRGAPRHIIHRQSATERKILMPEDITAEDLDAIAHKSTAKILSQANGSTCHQCRQKTIDMKTVCRSKTCIGIRGQFCGICLRNRYGEDAETALLDPNWECPPCRDICNCSICRNHRGIGCTGILIHLAKQQGFNNVKDYLTSIQED